MMSNFKNILKSNYGKIIIAVIILVVIYIIFKVIQGALAKRDRYSSSASQEFVNTNLTFTDHEYENMAIRLLDAMSGSGTREDVIYNVLSSLQTKDDWYKLVNVFGVRESTSMWSSWSGNLVEWLSDELNAKEQEKISNILEKLGVNY